MRRQRQNLTGNYQGIVLAQTLAVLGILVLLTAVSIPFLRQYQPTLKLRTAARLLITDLRYTQQLTITEQNTYYLEMDIVGNSYQIIKQSAPNSLVKTVALEEEVNFQSITGLTDNRVVYNSYGAVGEQGKIILVNSDGNTITINVRPSGYVQLQ